MNEIVGYFNTDERINNLLPICQVKFISIALIIFMLKVFYRNAAKLQ